MDSAQKIIFIVENLEKLNQISEFYVVCLDRAYSSLDWTA